MSQCDRMYFSRYEEMMGRRKESESADYVKQRGNFAILPCRPILLKPRFFFHLNIPLCTSCTSLFRALLMDLISIA